MKKSILIIVAFTLMANYSFSQRHRNDFGEQPQFGLKVGLNYSNVYDAQGEVFNANSKFGLVAGAFLTIPITKYIGFQPELLFSQKGFQATGVILGSPYNMTRTTSYIDVPLLLSVKPSRGVTLLIGPQYSYLIHQSDIFTNASISTQQEQEFKNDNIRQNILCFLGGADFKLKNITLGARIGWDVQNNNGDGTTTTPRYKNVWYQATIGFRI